jgi:LysM repeat protein
VTFREHVVKSGETLGGIGKRYGVPVADIRAANHNIAANRLRLNMTLIIPVSPAFDPRSVVATEQPQRHSGRAARGTTTWHTVRRGESWWSISQRYNVRVADLQAWNDAGPREKLRIGEKVRVSRGRSGTAAQRGSTTTARTAPRPASTTARPATYKVKSGDTLSDISVRFNVPIAELRRLNGMTSQSALKAGKVLKLR